MSFWLSWQSGCDINANATSQHLSNDIKLPSDYGDRGRHVYVGYVAESDVFGDGKDRGRWW